MKTFLAAAYLSLAATAASADTGDDLAHLRTERQSCSSDFQADEIVALLRTNRCIPSVPGAVEKPVVEWLAKNLKTARRGLVKAVASR